MRLEQPMHNMGVSHLESNAIGTRARLEGKTEREHMSSLVEDMLLGVYTTDDLMDIFLQYPPENLTAEQLAGCLDGVLETAFYTIAASRYDKPVVVPAGTGGDMKDTINITTMAGFVMAASGECVVPLYGNRKASGKFGKMDVLEALGLHIDLSPEDVHRLIKTTGIAPVFARTVYPGAKYVAQARTEFGKPTLFNIVMPQAAPVTTDALLLIGSAKADQLENMGKIAQRRGVRKAVFVHNLDHQIDEVATGRNRIVIVDNDTINSFEISLGEKEDIELLQAQEPTDFVRLFEQTLNPIYNNAQLDAIRRVVALNAACGLFLASNESDFTHSFFDYYNQSLSILHSGTAKQKLDEVRGISL